MHADVADEEKGQHADREGPCARRTGHEVEEEEKRRRKHGHHGHQGKSKEGGRDDAGNEAEKSVSTLP